MTPRGNLAECAPMMQCNHQQVNKRAINPVTTITFNFQRLFNFSEYRVYLNLKCHEILSNILPFPANTHTPI